MAIGNGFASEAQFQAAFVKWFDEEIPEDRGMLYCNNNNSHNRMEGNKAKALGVKSGVSDLTWVRWAGKSVFIELKQPGKKQSEEQIKFQKRVEERGHVYVLFEYLETAKEFVWKITGKK